MGVCDPPPDAPGVQGVLLGSSSLSLSSPHVSALEGSSPRHAVASSGPISVSGSRLVSAYSIPGLGASTSPVVSPGALAFAPGHVAQALGSTAPSLTTHVPFQQGQ